LIRILRLVDKWAFEHMETKKLYVVGAYSREDACEQLAEICGDYNFREVPIPEQYQ